MTQNRNVVPLWKIQFVIKWIVHYTNTKEIVFLKTKKKPTKILKHYYLETMKLKYPVSENDLLFNKVRADIRNTKLF